MARWVRLKPLSGIRPSQFFAYAEYPGMANRASPVEVRGEVR